MLAIGYVPPSLREIGSTEAAGVSIPLT